MADIGTRDLPAPPQVASSARVWGPARLGEGARLAQGTMVRATAAPVEVGAGSVLFEVSSVVAAETNPVRVGRRSVFGHRCVVVGASVGDLCELGNGTILMPGASLGDRVFTGEGTLIPVGMEVPDDSVVVGRPGRVIRRVDDADLIRLKSLRGGDLSLIEDAAYFDVHQPSDPTRRPGASMGTTYSYRGTSPTIDESAVVFDSAEITGDVVIGAGSIIAGGVKIIGDSHGPVRIGARVQILENTVLHLLPDNDLVIEDDVVIGPSCMIHGCHIGAASVVEPGAQVCDWSVVGPGSIVRAGSLVKQRDHFEPGRILDGFPARDVGPVPSGQSHPHWAFDPDHLPS